MAWAQQNVLEEVVIHGTRRIPPETVRARIFTRAGDVYEEAALQRDFHSLWNTGYFEDLRFEREEAPKGWRIHIYVKEKPTIREINYVGLSSVSQSEVLDRFRERKVGLTQESQYDPTRVKKAEVTLKELLAERGRQFATIRTEVRQIPPAAVGVTFTLKEGPKVKVGKIKFEGNQKLSSRYLRRSMRNLRPLGIPKSIVLENIFSKTFDASKLSEDAERVRNAYQERGYFKAIVQDPKTQIRDRGGFRVPLIQKGGGKAVDITIPIEEGERFNLGSISFQGNKAITSQAALRSTFPVKDGDIFNVAHIRKGLENLRKAYGELGYINFTAVPDTRIDDDKKQIHLEIDVDEGKQFYVRRIEFQGNTTTRDKVIRRELALEEGGLYNSRAWEFSILRLNQLGYFEQLKPEQDSETKPNNQEGTVDILLKVKEKGKNSIGLTGGVSGLAGSFIGINYETNNLFGLGVTMRVEANIGSRERNLLFSLVQPYMFDRPLQMGFTVFTRRFEFDQAELTSIATGQQLNLPQSFLDVLQNYTQSSTGFSVSASYQLRRSLKRVGIIYAFDTSSLTPFSQASRNFFETLAFRGLSGPNALQGVVTSKVLPSFSFNSIDSPVRPSSGRSLYVGGEISGLGGNVRALRPVVEFKMFRPLRRSSEGDHPHVLGFRLQGSFLTGYGGLVAPPFERFYQGGDTDLRGFDIRSVSPVAFLVQNAPIPLLNPDGTPVPIDPTNPRRGNITVPVPVRRIVFPGGDTSMVANAEYRIPIVGPVVLAPFVDFGLNFITRESQLRISDDAFNDLNSAAFGCSGLDVNFNCTGTLTGLTFDRNLQVASGTNFVPRMSTGLEVQVMLPVINAPFRVYWAYNPLLLSTTVATPNQCGTAQCITRELFPPGAAGDFTYLQTLRAFAPDFRLKEPRKTFRFTVSTTF